VFEAEEMRRKRGEDEDEDEEGEEDDTSSNWSCFPFRRGEKVRQ
jgi:hypothetical protein